MFQPQLDNHNCPNIVQFTYDTITATDLKYQETLWNFVILSGGNTSFKGSLLWLFYWIFKKGFGERFVLEMKKIRPKFELGMTENDEDREQNIVESAVVIATLSNFDDMLEKNPSKE